MSDIRPYGLDPTHLGEDGAHEPGDKTSQKPNQSRSTLEDEARRAFFDNLRADTPYELGQIGLDGQYYPYDPWDGSWSE